MKTVYFIRHAKSFWDVPVDLPDRDRPLAERGWRDSLHMGQHLLAQDIRLDGMLCSPACRALATATRVAGVLNLPVEQILLRQAIYEAEPEGLLQVLHTAPEGWQSLALVGHNPEFTALAQRYSPSPLDNVPTCGVFGLSWAVETWAAIQSDLPADWIFWNYPKNLA